MSEIIRAIESEQLKKDLPKFNVGDTLRVMVKVVEGDRERLQAFEGICIAKRNGSIRETFTLRRVSYGIGVERMLAACMRGTQSVHTSCGGAPRSTRARPASRCARAIRFINRAQGVVFAMGVSATTRRANPGYSTAHASACIPPMEAPTTA